MGRKGGGIPQAFDPDDWDEIKSVVDIPVYVAKGKGQYAGEGGFMTTLLSALSAVANNPTVRRLGKKAAKHRPAGIAFGSDGTRRGPTKGAEKLRHRAASSRLLLLGEGHGDGAATPRHGFLTAPPRGNT